MSTLRYLLSIPLPLRIFGILISLVVAALFATIIDSIAFTISSGVLHFSEPPKEQGILQVQKQIISCGPVANNYTYYQLETIEPNDNRHPAGQLKEGVLTINLEVREGIWYPETPVNPGIAVYAFAEEGKQLQIPGPLIRVPEGTEIALTIRNPINNKPLNLHGFHARPGDAKDSVIIQPGASWNTRFRTGEAGTYYYKGNMGGRQVAGFATTKDGQLYGGLIIDKTGVSPDTTERLLMIGRYIERLANQEEKLAVAINGLSWPFTERLTYKEGEAINWRVINSSAIIHPMHLHGFYFNVHSIGDAETDRQYVMKDIRKVVTQLLSIGQSMRMSWIPERPGNWLFHCHMLIHMSPDNVRLRQKLVDKSVKHTPEHHVQEEMAGLIMGIQILPNTKLAVTKPLNKIKRRRIDLLVKEFSSPFDSVHSFSGLGFVLKKDKTAVTTETPSMPGPPLIIYENEPVAINVINQSNEPTSIHWHGIELENYFDGVAGWGADDKKVSPLIEPGHSFVAEMTAPHAGTFIYHTHMHNNQLMRGLYGPLIVLRPGAKFDSLTDKIIVISDVRRRKVTSINDRKFLVNGSPDPHPFRLKKGKKYRLRLINITESSAAIQASLMLNANVIRWRALAKDGAELPPHQSVVMEANRQPIAVGETMDFEFLPKEPGEYNFEVYVHTPNLNMRVVKLTMIVQ